MGFFRDLRLLGQSLFSSKKEKAVWTLQFFSLMKENPFLEKNEIVELMKQELYERIRHKILAESSDEEIRYAVEELKKDLDSMQ